LVALVNTAKSVARLWTYD